MTADLGGISERTWHLNAEELLAIASDLVDEYEGSQLVSRVTRIRDALRHTANNPGDGRAQQALAVERTAIREASEASRVNDYPPVWKNRLNELDIAGLIGQPLSDRIEAIFLENEITPQAAHDQIAPIVAEIEGTLEALRDAANGLRFLGIGDEQSEPGECELSVLIPASRENSEAERLATELAFVDSAVRLFSEMAGLGRPPTRVRALASSDFLIYVYAAYEAINGLGTVIEHVTQMHSRLKRLKELASEFRQLRGPERLDEVIRTEFDDELERQIDEITDHVVSEIRFDDEGRARELRTEVRRTVRGIAARVDNGFRYDIRMELPPGDVPETVQAQHEKVSELATRIVYSPQVEHPVLELPPLAKFVMQDDVEDPVESANVDHTN